MTDHEIHKLNGTDAIDRFYEAPERDYREEMQREGRDCLVNCEHVWSEAQFLIRGSFKIGYRCERCNKTLEYVP